MYYFFFFQAEDGIRDIGVTGVQTCALPICLTLGLQLPLDEAQPVARLGCERGGLRMQHTGRCVVGIFSASLDMSAGRSGEGRVGREGRSRGAPDPLKKKNT